MNDAGQQLERGRLAGAIRPEERRKLAGLDGQIDAANRLDRAILAAKQPLQRRHQPFVLLVNAVGLRQLGDLNDGHGEEVGCGW